MIRDTTIEAAAYCNSLADLVLTGCAGKASLSGGPDDQSAQFRRHGFGITFRYPASLREADDLIFGTIAGNAERPGPASESTRRI